MNENWYTEIKESKNSKNQYTWVVTGWYEDEKLAYDLAETKWNQRQQDGWDRQAEKRKLEPKPLIVSTNLDLTDDHFNWNVEMPK